jgi:hypothetical protein
MGLLDYLKKVNMPDQQGMTFVDRAYSNPMLQTGIGILANNTGNYGAFWPAFSRGIGQGMKNVMDYRQQQADNQDRALQRQLYGLQVKAQKQKAQQEYEDEIEAKEQGRQWLTSMGIDMDNPGGFLKVSATPQPIKSSPLPVGEPLQINDVVPDVSGRLISNDLSYAPPPPENQLDNVLTELGYTDGMKKFFYAQARSNPEKAMAKLSKETTDYIKAQRSGRFAARDVLAKERAIQQEIDSGSALGRRLQAERVKQPAAVINNYGSPVAATGPNGEPVFLRFPKDSGPPIAVPGYMPPEKPTEAEAKAATFFQQMDAASTYVDSVERSFDPSRLSSQIDIRLAGGATNPLSSAEAQKYRQAQEQWSEAFLRVKTGAAATQDEVDRNIRTFFPQIGDSKAVVDQKRQARKKAEQDVRAMGGTANRRIEREQAKDKPTPAPAKAQPKAKFLGFE